MPESSTPRFSDDELAALEALADAAEPGPWELDHWGSPHPNAGEAFIRSNRLVVVALLPSMDAKGGRETADFIAATDPETVKALVAEVRELRELLAEAARFTDWSVGPPTITEAAILHSAFRAAVERCSASPGERDA